MDVTLDIFTGAIDPKQHVQLTLNAIAIAVQSNTKYILILSGNDGYESLCAYEL